MKPDDIELIGYDNAALTAFQAVDDEERRQLAPFISGSPIPVPDTARRAYAVWLRGRDDVRAALLELALDLTESPFPDDTDRAAFTALLAQVDPGWWRLVQPRPYQLNCGAARDQPGPIRFAFKCPMQWQQLAATDDPNARHCDRCGEDVYRVETLEAAEAHARLGNCISVPSAIADSHTRFNHNMTGRPAHPVHQWATKLFGPFPRW